MAKKKKYYGGMISEDKSAPSNFPPNAFIKRYPMTPMADDQAWIDDTLSGTDAQMEKDAKGIRRQKPKFKF